MSVVQLIHGLAGMHQILNGDLQKDIKHKQCV